MNNQLVDITKSGAQDWRDLNEQNQSQFTAEDYKETLGLMGKLGSAPSYIPNSYFGNRSTYTDYTDMVEGTGFGESKYDAGATIPEDLFNIEELRAQQQSYLEQLGMGALKMGTIGVTTFLDNYIGTLVGAANVVKEAAEGNITSGKDALDAFVRNPFSVFMQEINEKSEEWFPNYYTEEEKNTPWYKQWWRANFIGDHFLKNTGFMLGAAASAKVNAGMLSKVMGLEKARDVFRGTVLAAGAPEGTAAKEVLKAYKTGKSIAGVEEITESLAQSAKQLKNAELGLKLAAGVSGSFGESRMEAITNSNDYLERNGKPKLDEQRELAIQNILPNLQAEYPDMFTFVAERDIEGRITGYKSVPKDPAAFQELYNQKIQQIDTIYNSALAELTKEQIDYSNTSFLVNLLLTSAENIQLFGDAITGGYTMNRAMRDLVTKKGTEYEVLRGLAAKKIARGAASPFFEGTQEMFQQATTVGLNRWEGKKFNDFYGQGLNPDGLRAATNWLSTMTNALGDVYTNPDEWENFAMGFLTAFLPIPGRAGSTITTDKKGNPQVSKGKLQLSGEFWDSIREAKEVKQQATATAKALNDLSADPNKRDMILSMVRHMDADERQTVATEKGDKKAFKDAEFDKFINAAITFSEAGKAQDFLDLIEAYYTIDEKDIDGLKAMTMFKDGKASLFDGMKDSEIIDYFKQKKDKVIKLAKKIQKTESDITTLYGDSRSKEFKQELIYDIMAVDNREQRIKEITTKLFDYVNTRKKDLRDKYGYDVGEDLQTIEDLNVFFGNEEGIDELNNLINQASAGSERAVVQLNKKLAERTAKRKQLSGRILGLSNSLNKLAEKDADGTITDEERKRLSQLKRRVSRAKNDISRIAETINNLKDHIQEEGDKYNPELLTTTSELNDLIGLLVNREYLLHRLNALSADPESFEDDLSVQLESSINFFNNRKLDRIYDDFAKTRDLSLLMKNGVSFNALKEKVDAGNDEKLKGYVASVEKYSNIFEAEDSPFDLETPVASALYLEVQEAIKDANSVEEADKRVKELITVLDSTESLGEETSKLTKTLSKAMAIDKKVKEAIDKEGVSGKKEAKKSKSSVSPKLSKIKDIKNEVDELDKDELLDFIEEYGLGDAIEEFFTVDGEEPIFEGGYAEADKEDLRNAIITVAKEMSVKEEESEESEESEDIEEDENIEEDEEEVPEEIGEEEKPTRNGGSSEAVKAEVGPEEGVGETSKRAVKKPTTSGPIYIKNTDDFEIGNSETNHPGDNGPIKTEDAIAVNRQGAKYEFSELKNIRIRKATLNKTRTWAGKVLENAGVQEFLDSGQLAILQREAAARGEKLKVRFVQIRGNEGEEKVFKGLHDKHRKQKNTIFVAVEIPKNTEAKAPYARDYYGVDGNKKHMQLLGIASVNERTAPKATVKRFQKLREAVQLQTSAAKTRNNKIQPFAYSDITTDVEWIFTGRIVKSTDDSEVEERDLYEIFSDFERAAQKKGKDQLQIVVKRSDFVEDDIVIGEDLDGEVVELNKNRPETGGRNRGLRNKSDRVGTVWIRTKEADGKIYYKGVKIRNFDEDYIYDDSPIAKRIKAVITNMIKSRDAKWQDAAIGLQRYLYIPSGKRFYIDAKNKTFRIGSESVDFDSEDAVQEIYDLLKAQGYRFSIGLAKTSVSDILNSHILYTDLATLHNVNSSFLVSEVDVELSENEKDVEGFSILPSKTVAQVVTDHRVHTGQLGIQGGRDRSHNIKLADRKVEYAKYSDGTYWIMSGEHQQEEVTDPKTQFLIEFKFLIDLKRLEPIGYVPKKKGQRGKGTNIYMMKDTNDSEVYMTTDGRVLTLEDRKNLNIVKKGGKDKDAAINSLRRRLTPDEENPSKEPKVPAIVSAMSDEQLSEIVDGNIEDDDLAEFPVSGLEDFKVGDTYEFRDPSTLEIISTDTITKIDDDMIHFKDEDGNTTSINIVHFLNTDAKMKFRLAAEDELKRRAKKSEPTPTSTPAPATPLRTVKMPGKTVKVQTAPQTSSEQLTEDFFTAVKNNPELKARMGSIARAHNIKTIRDFKEGFKKAAESSMSDTLKKKMEALMSSVNPEDLNKVFDIVEDNIICFGISSL